MIKLKNLSAFLFIAAALVSCNMVPWDEIENLGEIPTLINKVPRLYPGGNAECSTTGIQGLAQTTGRNNYDQSLHKFENAWPSGLLVKVYDDKSVTFQINGSVNLGDGKCYKVGAVIVKGSDASNVYDYTDIGGATMDKGLVAPNNSSGGPASLSNLTFCFVECEVPQLIIAVKSFYWAGSTYETEGYAWTGSSGTYIFLPTTDWCQYLGINYYPATSTFPMLREVTRENVGTVTIVSGINSLIVTVALKEGGMLDKTYLYVGTYDGIYGTGSCPDYTSWPNQDMSDSPTHTFVIPY